VDLAGAQGNIMSGRENATAATASAGAGGFPDTVCSARRIT
jgi:hypothetical protein